MADAWGISWRSLFRVWGAVEATVAPTVPTFGPPFLDLQSAIRTALGTTNLMVTAIGTDNPISPHIELQNGFRSARIDRSLT
jgi:hypothetical protein